LASRLIASLPVAGLAGFEICWRGQIPSRPIKTTDLASLDKPM